MIVLKCEQRSPEWYKARLGVITASGCYDMMTPSRRKAYALKLLAEKMTGEADAFAANDYMQWGIDYEQYARMLYEKKMDVKVEEVGFVFKDEERLVGCSPDGLVGDDGLIEIKCPSSKVHISNMSDGPAKTYFYQMQFQMFVCGRQWCDFVSYDPRIIDCDKRLYVKRIERDQETIWKISSSSNATIHLMEKLRGKIYGTKS